MAFVANKLYAKNNCLFDAHFFNGSWAGKVSERYGMTREEIKDSSGRICSLKWGAGSKWFMCCSFSGSIVASCSSSFTALVILKCIVAIRAGSQSQGPGQAEAEDSCRRFLRKSCGQPV